MKLLLGMTRIGARAMLYDIPHASCSLALTQNPHTNDDYTNTIECKYNTNGFVCIFVCWLAYAMCVYVFMCQGAHCSSSQLGASRRDENYGMPTHSDVHNTK